MVLPVVAAALGIAYMISKKEIMSKIAARATLVAALAMIGVWYTGSQAGPLVYKLLSPAGQHELLEHKELGLYLAIAMGLIALLQIAGCKLKKFSIEAIAIILLVGAMFTTFLQGKDGGEIVYDYGQPFQMHQVTKYLNNSDDLDMADDVDDAVDLIKTKLTDISKNTPAKIQGKVQK
jgi:cell division protein FtsW (lipid II flippase)